MWEWLKHRIGRRASAAPNIESLAMPAGSGEGSTESGRVTVLYAKFQPNAHTADLDPLWQTPAAKVSPPAGATCIDAPLAQLAFQKPRVPLSVKQKRRRKRAFRFMRQFSQMDRFELRLLLAIHRTSIRALAAETPAALHRDLRRFSLSTRGQRILRGRPLPTLAKVRDWVIEARRSAAKDSQAISASPR